MFLVLLNVVFGVTFLFLGLIHVSMDHTDSWTFFLFGAAVVALGSSFQLVPRHFSLVFMCTLVSFGVHKYFDQVSNGDIELFPLSHLLKSKEGFPILGLEVMVLHAGLCSLYGPSLKNSFSNWIMIIITLASIWILLQASGFDQGFKDTGKELVEEGAIANLKNQLAFFHPILETVKNQIQHKLTELESSFAK